MSGLRDHDKNSSNAEPRIMEVEEIRPDKYRKFRMTQSPNQFSNSDGKSSLGPKLDLAFEAAGKINGSYVEP